MGSPAEGGGSSAAGSSPRWPGAVLAAWVLSLGVDLLLHGGLLARLYVEPHPALLAPREAFRRIPWILLAAWWLAQSLELAAAGAVLGAALERMPSRRLWFLVAMVVVGCLGLTVALQSVGWAPAARVAP
jgi:hypothetical protein